MVQLVLVLLTAALPIDAQRGLVRNLQVADADVQVGQQVTFRVTGTNPCGAVQFTYGDGRVVTHPISEMPATFTYQFESAGSYRVEAKGMGNCDGTATAAIRVRPDPRRDARDDERPGRFAGMDRNRDGIITRDEWRGSQQSFRVHDWNSDGILSGDEVRTGANRGEVDDRDGNELLDWTPRRFRQLDTNRDGRLTRAEWRYSPELFRRVDRNRDGVLAEAEFIGDPDDDRNDRFEYLDTNNDGRIERGEWHGSRGAFDWLDVDNDGVLTRAEAAGDDDRRGEGSRPGNVVVDPTEQWVDTGIDVRPGDSLTFAASGSVQLSNDTSDVADPAGARSGRRAADAPIRAAPAGALIARIGLNPPVVVGGRRGALRSPYHGRLYLSVNDDFLGDNRGEFRVQITVDREIR